MPSLAVLSYIVNISEKIRVIVVDDDPLAVQTLSLYFSQSDGFEVVATAQNGVEALEKIKNIPVDVVLADIHMPGMNGLTLQKELVQLPYRGIFLAITSIDNDEYVLRTLRYGGSGYVLKSQRPESIIQSVRDAVRGGVIVSPDANIVKSFSTLVEGQGSRRVVLRDVLLQSSNFSAVEKETISLLCEGLSNAEIAHRLHYSESAVKKRVSKLIHEFHATSRLDLVVKLLNPR